MLSNIEDTAAPARRWLKKSLLTRDVLGRTVNNHTENNTISKRRKL
jgi:hypothetical protein